jgi:hypothetical protein
MWIKEIKMKEQQITQTLQTIAKEQVPDTVNLWPIIESRLQPQKSFSQRRRLLPNIRLGWVFLSLVLILTFGAVADAVSPAVMRLFEQESGLQYVTQSDLVQELALSQTVDGITVTLERAYADANRIVIGFTLQTPGDRRYEAHRLTLTDAAGNSFPRTVGYGVTGQSDIYKASLPPGEGAYAFEFDASGVVGAPEELSLRLMMELEGWALPMSTSDDPQEEGPLSLRVAPQPPPLEQAGSMTVELEPLPVGDVVAGPFTFDFRVPFIQGHTVEVQQTTEAAGVAITLEKVIITPSETQATLCFVAPDKRKEWLLITEDGGEDRYGGTINRLNEGSEKCHRLIYSGALPVRFGRGTLKVTELVGFDPTGAGEQTRLAGPWVFRFRMP